jgi:hypothetical protein
VLADDRFPGALIARETAFDQLIAGSVAGSGDICGVTRAAGPVENTKPARQKAKPPAPVDA